MTWLSDEKGCGKCDNCGMDMDMEPFCVDSKTLATAKETLGREFPWGLNINPARIICKGHQWTPRKERS
jgi:hypothetical protein